MCGIAGFVGRGTINDLRAMTDALAHRGPDGAAHFVDSDHPVFLGHRRLAVIDPKGGVQPMWNEDSTVGIVFNGMIYNHGALRTELERCGHIFRSDHSDTEVLVHGFEEWGRGLVDRLNGMFAFAIFDRKTRKLFLARDRFGEKPLFYAVRKDAFVFASEVSAILSHAALAGAETSAVAMRKFFAYGFLPAPWTHISGIHKLPQGHCLELDLDTLQPEIQRYWRYAILPDAAPPGSPSQWAEDLDALLGRAVAGRLDSDVPLGVFLSGGIDSSTILSHAADARGGGATIDSFAIGFREPSFDESAHAARMADHVGSRHHLFVCDLAQVRDLILDLPAIIDEPLGDSSILPTYLLSGFARQHVTVALSGDGADELLAGYDPFKALATAKLYGRLVSRPVHHAIAALAQRLPPSETNMSFDFKLNRGLRGLGKRPALWNPMWLGAASLDEMERLFGQRLDPEDLYSEAIAAWDGAASRDPVDRTLEFYTNFYLPDDILVKSDRASMRHGLEVRAPFLDNDVVDFVRRLPADVKLRHGVTKWILKQASAKRLPEAILGRRKKGFGVPIARWLRELPATCLPTPPHVDATALDAMWREHRALRRDRRGVLWGAFVSAGRPAVGLTEAAVTGISAAA